MTVAIPDIDSWIFKTGVVSYSLYSASGVLLVLFNDLRMAESYRLLAGGSFSVLIFLLNGPVYVSRNFVRLTYDVYGIFETGISYARIPKLLMNRSHLLFSTTIFILGQIAMIGAIPLYFVSFVIDEPQFLIFLKVWDTTAAVFFIMIEVNTLIASLMMKGDLGVDFEMFRITEMILVGLIAANAWAGIAGLYSLMYLEFGRLSLECFALLCGAQAMVAYGEVFRWARALRNEGTKLSVISRSGNQPTYSGELCERS
ncbi:hypothetical protein NEOLI_001630 [Neolecta irregularis DAH-3]|uniref:Uncharacterized protein n=1 Tax=Neolecta irregularis (strain DAH-3) TaxID=1198029 RepID=A0A1U7LLL0_NEOID|nr:hypothetical protein NEOLI_001630 [Neolecta irregularis DAH-3]|eukprot:OLL23545.1 hypothetical protein NEOLI_001630 [Neolecta irregularis DAH-3]